MPNSEFHLDYGPCRDLLLERLREPAPSRIQILTGPRQVGKTTLLLELAERQGERTLYAAADQPGADLPGFWERLWAQAEERARSRGDAIVLLDEIQHLDQWAARLKSQWDRIRRRRLKIHVVVTGSSALRLGEGSRESLSGRFERITLTHWSASALVDQLGAGLDEVANLYVRMGSYPGAYELRGDQARWRAYVRDAIIEPAIGRDILASGAVRRPALLRQVFTLCVSSPSRIVSLQKLQGQLQDPGALETIAHYLRLLEDAYLIVGCEKYSQRTLRRRSSPPKIVALNNGLIAAMDPAGIPDSETQPERFGPWVENACLAHAWNAGQRVMYWREEPLEVDGILEGSWGTWAVEVKTRACRPSDLRGVLEFCRRHQRFKPLVLVGRVEDVGSVRETGAAAMPWWEFLLSGAGGKLR